MQQSIQPVATRLRRVFRGTSILAAVLCLLPFFLLAEWRHDANWQKATVVTISALIVYRETKSGPLLVLVHGLAMVLGFMALFLAIPHPWLFVALCAGLGISLLGLTGWDRTLRSFGTWTFIPVLYAAIENGGDWHGGRLDGALQLMPYLAWGVLPVLLLNVLHRCAAAPRAGVLPMLRHLSRWHHLERRLGNGIDAVLPALAAALAVGLCAWLFERHAIPEGQWFIWSAASVITGELQSTSKKIRDRVFGALVGVPSGIALGLFIVPHSDFWINVAGLLTLVTIVAFREYRPAFAARCAGHALIITLLGGSLLQEGSRLVNVVGGGVIGIAIFYAMHLIRRHPSFLLARGRMNGRRSGFSRD
ncbi:FUSC family protein [Paludibacterium purpuratum]|uniref:Fusaric acid resistance family protein n=1 Tax=Paludibacterium purpuratum TaxID=1144873 RepID=A0A4V3DVD7_9NEIS|nr:FUSC family protein [Paludibacterium purpuratum]TDR80579.1 fusaric acid resistance family protein [Paludibacterium purpuratum]